MSWTLGCVAAERRLLLRNDGAFADAAVVDVGMGERPWTTLELGARGARGSAGLRVIGVEVDERRALAARRLLRVKSTCESGVCG